MIENRSLCSSLSGKCQSHTLCCDSRAMKKVAAPAR